MCRLPFHYFIKKNKEYVASCPRSFNLFNVVLWSWNLWVQEAVMVNLSHLLPACSPCSLLFTPCPQFLQFPIATSWTRRDFWVDTLLWKTSFLPSTASWLCRSLWKIVCVCSLELTEFSQRGKSSAGGGKEKDRKGEGRLLHMSVAMGILVQWLCSNVAAGMEDSFLQGRFGERKKKRSEHELELHSPIMRRGAFI